MNTLTGRLGRMSGCGGGGDRCGSTSGMPVQVERASSNAGANTSSVILR